MPLYDYQCRDCKTIKEVRHGFRESHDERCPSCGGELARVFNPAGIVFKGSGFYVTDSRKSSGSGTSSDSSSTSTPPSTTSSTSSKSENAA